MTFLFKLSSVNACLFQDINSIHVFLIGTPNDGLRKDVGRRSADTFLPCELRNVDTAMPTQLRLLHAGPSN